MRSTIFSTTRSAAAAARAACGLSMKASMRHPSSSSSAMSWLCSGWLSFGAIAVQRVGLQAPISTTAGRRTCSPPPWRRSHVDGLGDRTRDERLRRRHHADVAVDRQIAACRSCRTDWRSRTRRSARPSGAAHPRPSSRRRRARCRPRSRAWRSRDARGGRTSARRGPRPAPAARCAARLRPASTC